MNGWPIRLAVPIALLVLTGCREDQSVLFPQGPRAAHIAHLAWLLFGGGSIILIIVIIALWLAIRGSPQARARLAGQGAVVAGGIIFPAITLSALLGYEVMTARATMQARDDGAKVLITVVGEQWWWRITYHSAERTPVPSANEIRIPVGREIEFTLESADVIHSFWIPSLGGKVDMIPGRSTRLRVTADRAGIFRGQCAEYCGGPHALMALAVIAMPEAEFENKLLREAAPAESPSTAVEHDGMALFLAAGCGACHAIRGTDASGTVGPDLTHLGSRRSVGVDTLPLTPDNIARFIVDGQHVKRGNTMPPFRVFSDQELNALASYLVNLR